MLAKVKADYRFNFVRACQGIEFNKREFIPVPPACENEARQHPYLEIFNQPEPGEPTPPALTGIETQTPRPRRRKG